MLREDLTAFQVLVGPRQVGKTTAAHQVIAKMAWPSVVAAADTPLPPGPEWVENQWHLAKVKAAESKNPVILVLDEVQKVRGWSESLKRLYGFGMREKGLVKSSY